MGAFVGRERELEQLQALLTPRRVVTVAGPGGIGKSRLVREFVARMPGEDSAATCFVHVAGLEDRVSVVQAVAGAIGFAQNDPEPLEDRVVEALRRYRLLVLDEAERAAAAIAPFVLQLTQACPNLSVLITSRAAIAVAGERVLQLGPLDGAKELFLQRLAASRPDLAVTAEAAAAIDGICRKLGGIPLAVELAAADVATRTTHAQQRSVEQLDAHLGAYARQIGEAVPHGESGHFRALSAMLDWSYRSLPERERRGFARLAVFDGSFTLVAAQAVAFEERAGEELAALLETLVGKALVRVSAGLGDPRFSLHPVVREFADERLREMHQTAACAKRYCDYYCGVACDFAAGDGDLIERIDALGADWENVRGSLHLTLEARCDVDTGSRAVAALGHYWTETGKVAEGWYWILCALEAAPAGPRRAALLYAAAVNAHARGDFVELEKFCRELIPIFEREGDPGHLSRALNGLANARYRLGDDAEAQTLYLRALEQYRLAGDRRGEAVALMNLGALTADRRLEYARARTYFLESLAIFSELGISTNVGTLLANLAEIASRQGEHDRALEYAEKSRAVFERLGNKGLAAWQDVNMAQFHLGRRELARTKEALLQAWPAVVEQVSSREHSAAYFDTAAMLAAELGEIEAAAQLFGYAQAFRDLYRTPRTPSISSILMPRMSLVEHTLGTARSSEAIARGASLDETQAERIIERLGSAQA